ncbi:MAG TPA: glycosyltransferase [Solirubrobacteraceae bacterium]|jgi:glycosyltransferase involved in cell wall biosynthesis/O-antigen/teichoic acid export membrane protein|nr:glycosyltransferase [Solirubrobacteraceae bacterium]
MPKPRHILVLTDRDWTHPQGGGTGTNLYGQIARWVAWGHRVTVVAGDYPGAKKVEELAPNLVVHRMGTRLTVFPRAAWATLRGLGEDADVVLEVVNGIAFFTPLWWWLRQPRVALVHHVHQDHYVHELGTRGRVAAFLLEHLPLRFLYRGTRVLTISNAARDDLIELGVERDRIHVVYMGVEQAQFHRTERSPEPTLLYLGRLKQYKRLEVLLDVLEEVPEAHLHVAGEGDHRPALEAEIDARGLHDRVTLHGFVDEDEKAELYGSAWVSLTASSAEGWCLTVMEAAACGTPSAALRVGGLAESIVDGQTGVLADTPEELAAKVRDLVRDSERRERLGAAAEARARGFTWDRTARENLAILERAAEEPAPSLAGGLRRSDTAKAAGMAVATLAANAIAVVFTIVFTRLLGVGDYGALGALLSTFTILAVAGSALQVAVARETALGRLGGPGEVGATVRRWTRQLLAAFAAVAGASLILREPIAQAVAVPEHAWAASAILPTGVLWLLLSVQRGALQGLHAYAFVGGSAIVEAIGRLAFGLVLVLGGLGVTGAFLGTPLSMAAAAVVLGLLVERRAGGAPAGARTRTLHSVVSGGWAPIVGLIFLAALQNVDVIVAKHQMTDDAAGAYAAAVVAAKLVVWTAIGIGLYLLPEATRRAAAGLDPRPVFMRTLALLAAVCVPALAIFAGVPALLLRVAFGEEYTTAADALIVLGAAMTLLAVAYLAVQYMLALRQTGFLWILGVVAVAEPFLLTAGDFGLVAFAAVVFALQCAAATGAVTLALRRRRAPSVAAT